MKSSTTHALRASLRKYGLHTVCEEAKCPNIGECFCSGTATFMIMGDTCTRNCKFCAVKHGHPMGLDENEPQNIADIVYDLNLKHVVVTSVTRDDLPDKGASHFVQTIKAIRNKLPGSTIEVLTPDFGCSEDLIEEVCNAKPNVFNHNIETVERLSSRIRSKATYESSLAVLRMVAKKMQGGYIKSGLMVGMGEKKEEVVTTLKDLYSAGCQIVTIGQYLSPSLSSWPVAEYIHPDEFEEYKNVALKIGFKYAFCGPFVRSSYMAHKVFESNTSS
ncbi:lipoyl synthase [bacterium]|nr:lipoyl synthase [bacterium]